MYHIYILHIAREQRSNPRIKSVYQSSPRRRYRFNYWMNKEGLAAMGTILLPGPKVVPGNSVEKNSILKALRDLQLM